jgi:DNA ligase D-like protein (predicted 3'-phosphoesterase)
MKNPLFVIQKHSASHLHYDFRLEYNGILLSWAVPKGPSLNPRIKRLAIPTPDHPYDYAHFEGAIPAGSYGAGTVMVWDIGTYRNIKMDDGALVSMKECLRRGTIEIFLKGKKLQGGFALIKTARGWLLIKMRDEYASARKNPVTTQNKSALTERTMRQIHNDSQEQP